MKVSIKRYIKLLSKYLNKSKLQLVILAILMGGTTAIQLINPQIVSYFIDGIEAKKSTKALVVAAIIFIIAAFAQQVFALGSTYLSQNIGWKTTNQLRLELVKHCLGLDMTFYKEHQSGEIVERIDGDVTALFNFFSKLLVSFLNNILLMIGIIAVMATKNLIAGFVFLIFLIAAFLVIWKTQGGAINNFGEDREMSAKFYGFLGEHIGSTEDIKANGASAYVMKRFYTILKKWLPVRLRAHLAGYKVWITIEGIFGVGYIMIFVLGGYLWFTNQISVGVVYLMVNYLQLLSNPLEQLREQLLDIQKATASIVRIDELLHMSSKIKEEASLTLDDERVSLNLDQVNFEYEANTPVLNNISFQLAAGNILGVLGHTGCGKTTLARLLVRFYDPNTGDIRLNQTSIKDIKIRELRKNIAYVTQDVQLFNASVRDNITFFNPDMDDRIIIRTLKEMGLGEWYENLTNGLDTMIEPGGGMSSGEAQLLALVRVFLKNPKIVILDEASSRLDPVTEKLVEKVLQRLMEGRTCIIIAHRLETIERADDIMILEKGSIIEYGKRKELIKDEQSKFSELLRCGIEEVLV